MLPFRADAVFEGGGVRGIGLVGAAEVAEEHGVEWVSLAGTSAGAIVAALLAAGYRAAELRDILSRLDLRCFRDRGGVDRLPLLGRPLSLLFEKGVYEGSYLVRWLGGLLGRRGVQTFGDLVDTAFAGDERHRFRLRVIAADVSRGRLLVLPQDIARFGVRPEDLSVALAVRMSMSIPFFYEPVQLRDMRTGRVSYIVDGGILSNFPVWLFDSQGPPRWPTFGFRLVGPGEVDGGYRQIRMPLDLALAIVSTMMAAHDARHLQAADHVRTISIPTLGIGTTRFGISAAERRALYEAGRKAAADFFAGWDFGRYVRTFRAGIWPAVTP